jgi:beta-galactosidase
MYMQSSLANDFFKGGWAATWESTGGPQQFSGGKGGAGFTVDERVMTQFILSQIAGGFKGFGLWAWNVRTAGWETGEYGLLDRHNQVTPRAIKVGKIAQAMQTYRDEIWEAKKEPLVGILYDWDNEAIWAAKSEQGRDQFRMEPIYARIGISRALMNANIPFEYVTVNDLKKGLGPRYQVIFMPQQIAISSDLMGLLTGFVKQGGRLVADLPLAYFDEYAALLYSDSGSPFESLFGTTINDFQYAGVNATHFIDDMKLAGFVINQTPSTAVVLAEYDNGLPAITENSLGKGKAVALGYQASMMCFEPGNDLAEKHLLKFVLGGKSSPYSAEGALVYRLATPC